MKKNYLISLIAVLLLSGCVSVTKYDPPTSGPTANLRIKSHNIVTAFQVTDSSCENMKELAVLGNILMNRTEEESSNGMAWLPGSKEKIEPTYYKELVIPAGKPFHLYYFGVSSVTSKYCHGNKIIDVEEGANYEFSMSCTTFYGVKIFKENNVYKGEMVSSRIPDKFCKI
ncbi:hypothetical protein PVK63_01260 [Aliivibrio sp. S2TY2]|uniref:hypothetical protein n=1 Tax=unclassified Aliivibrio TaxID=2645654 RepID=UPI002378BCA3|nr:MULTISPECIES: hypothetical protein [unclassified Aliivibrio]MDD9173483.1 hypothetical protein [Aliivibrio sp. S3TY1]MDD9190559.1 hypothetical protein [Aliivibrio sp. S2TY2]